MTPKQLAPFQQMRRLRRLGQQLVADKIRDLQSKNRQTRMWAAHQLAADSEPASVTHKNIKRAIPDLTKALVDSNPDTRENAARAIINYANNSLYTDPLRKILRSVQRTWGGWKRKNKHASDHLKAVIERNIRAVQNAIERRIQDLESKGLVKSCLD